LLFRRVNFNNLLIDELIRKNLVDFCIADRTFSCIENILKNFKCGTLLSVLYKLFWFYKSDNTENFLKANMPKLALCDPNDSIVVEFSSLKSSLSLRYIKNKIPKCYNSILKFCLEDNSVYNNFIQILHLCYINQSTEKKRITIMRNSLKKMSFQYINLYDIKKRDNFQYDKVNKISILNN